LNKAGVCVSTREGGALIEYEDEDPQIKKDYEAAVRVKGVPLQMPEVRYRGD